MKRCKFMKALSIMILAFALIMGIGIQTEAASKKEKTGKAYAKIIKEYQKAYKYAKAGDSKKMWKLNINPEFFSGVGYNSTSFFVYRIMDFNKDGNQELFIALTNGSSSATIYDVYTFHNGKAVQLMQNIGYRAGTCSLRKGGIIVDTDGYASYASHRYHKLPKSKGKLKTVASISRDFSLEKQKMIYQKKVNNTWKKISKKEYDKIQKKYDKEKIKVTFYKATNKATKNIKKGKFNYKGQKKYSLTT